MSHIKIDKPRLIDVVFNKDKTDFHFPWMNLGENNINDGCSRRMNVANQYFIIGDAENKQLFRSKGSQSNTQTKMTDESNCVLVAEGKSCSDKTVDVFMVSMITDFVEGLRTRNYMIGKVQHWAGYQKEAANHAA